ncbi:MAG: Ku protein [Burkholderiales bacterium]
MPRAIWKGAISFGLVNIPIGLYPAAKGSGLSFTMLDRRDMSPVGYKRINKSSGAEVPWDEIVKGYEYEDGEYVVLGDSDFQRANVKATQTVELLSFVEAAQIHSVYYDTPYYLTPARKAEKGYALLRETLLRTGKVGIAKVVIRTREHLAALVPFGPMLVLELLRFAEELRDPNELGVPLKTLAELKVGERELAIAQTLVAEMQEDWKPEQYRDEYREDLMNFIEKKVKSGKTTTISEPVEEKEAGRKSADVIDLMALLKRSVAQTGRKPKKRGAVEPEKKLRRRA